MACWAPVNAPKGNGKDENFEVVNFNREQNGINQKQGNVNLKQGNKSTPTSTLDLVNDVARLDIDEPSAAATEIRRAPVNNPDKRCPGLITGHLPVELQLQIWSNLRVHDIVHVAASHESPMGILEHNIKTLARTIINRDMKHLFVDLHYFDFTGLGLVEAWHRYNSVFSFHRNLHSLIPFERLLYAFMDSNNLNLPHGIAEEDVHDQMCLVWNVSTWCLHHYSGGYDCVRNVRALQDMGWEPVLRAACGESEEYLPGAYGPLIQMWRNWLALDPTPRFIVSAFIEVNDRPLHDLRSWRATPWVSDLWQEYEDGYGNPPPFGKDVMVVPDSVRSVLTGMGLPKVYNGFVATIGTCTERGKNMLEILQEHGLEFGGGLVFAALVGELRIWWQ